MPTPSINLQYTAQLDKTTRAWALVGSFLGHWALMEGRIKIAIAKALDLENLQAAIVTSNIQFRDKIYILKTAIDMSAIYPEEDRNNFKKLLDKIAEYSTVRNMMAHEAFGASADGKGVEFFTVKAKGALNLDSTVWQIADFEAAVNRVSGYYDGVEELIARLQRAALVRAMLRPPTQAQGGVGLLGLLGPQPTSILGSIPPALNSESPANTETGPQTTPKSRG